jgi:hypothetical protein
MRWDREKLLPVSFVILSLGSAVYLSSITLNYLNYYPALGQLTAQVDSVSVVQASNSSRVSSQISISNPSDYSGFRIGEAEVSMFFRAMNSSDTLFLSSLANYVQPVGGQLATRSTVSATIQVQLSPSEASSFESFDTTYSGRVFANVTLTVSVITFLDPLVGRYPISSNTVVPVQG